MFCEFAKFYVIKDSVNSQQFVVLLEYGRLTNYYASAENIMQNSPGLVFVLFFPWFRPNFYSVSDGCLQNVPNIFIIRFSRSVFNIRNSKWIEETQFSFIFFRSSFEIYFVGNLITFCLNSFRKVFFFHSLTPFSQCRKSCN